jgi:hypothetical protein
MRMPIEAGGGHATAFRGPGQEESAPLNRALSWRSPGQSPNSQGIHPKSGGRLMPIIVDEFDDHPDHAWTKGRAVTTYASRRLVNSAGAITASSLVAT